MKIPTGPAIEISPEVGQSQISLPTLPHNQGYLITVESRNISGKPLLFWIENLNSRRADLESYLPAGRQVYQSYFIQSPMEADGLGYTLHFDNLPVGGQRGVNELNKVTVAPIDYWALVKQKITNYQSPITNHLSANGFLVEHPNPSWYRIDLPTGRQASRETLVLSQSFDPGWVAIGVNSNQQVRLLDSHILINNWENGWQLSGDERIVYLFYWPQLLEFAGLGILAIAVVILIGKMALDKRNPGLDNRVR